LISLVGLATEVPGVDDGPLVWITVTVSVGVAPMPAPSSR
jgi:hypothetical protein